LVLGHLVEMGVPEVNCWLVMCARSLDLARVADRLPALKDPSVCYSGPMPGRTDKEMSRKAKKVQKVELENLWLVKPVQELVLAPDAESAAQYVAFSKFPTALVVTLVSHTREPLLSNDVFSLDVVGPGFRHLVHFTVKPVTALDATT
jgi:hypothetical protein